MEPLKPVDNRRANGTFGPGNNANPDGRPKVQTLKEYIRQRFLDMTPEEKDKFISQLSPIDQFRMAEGNPHNTQDLTSKGERITNLLTEDELAERVENARRAKK